MPKVNRRNLKKRYKITHEPVRTDDVFMHGKPERCRVATDLKTGIKYSPDHRRMNPSIAGKLGKEKSITGTAKELYLNQGVAKRGLGGRGKRRSKH